MRSIRLKRNWALVLFFLAMSLLLQPWRSSVSQDDGHYSASAIALSRGEIEPHPLNNAAAWPQLALGASAIRLLPGVAPLKVLNGLTWFCFLVLVCGAVLTLPLDPLVIGSFFLFPIWVQYGASYLTDIYASLLLFGFFWALKRADQIEASQGYKSQVPRFVLCFFFSALLCLQQQSLLAFPILIGASLALSRPERHSFALGVTVLGGGAVGLVAYSALPRTELQLAFLPFVIEGWKVRGVFGALHSFLFECLQLGLSLGLFFLPFLLPFLTLDRKRKVGPVLWVLVAQILALVWLLLSPSELFSAGVLFTGYLPRVVNALFLSVGVWGLWGVAKLRHPMTMGTLAAVFSIVLFCAFREVADIRYVLPLTIPFLFFLDPVEANLLAGLARLGGLRVYFGLVFAVSIFTNQYNLNTTEARWEEARKLEAAGVPKIEISAGYGRDVHELSWSCADAAIRKLKAQGDFTPLHTAEAAKRFLRPTSRLYEDEWQSRYLIKPSRIFGKTLLLSKNLRPGQSLPPLKQVDYTVFGISNSIAVIDTGVYSSPWCLK